MNEGKKEDKKPVTWLLAGAVIFMVGLLIGVGITIALQEYLPRAKGKLSTVPDDLTLLKINPIKVEISFDGRGI